MNFTSIAGFTAIGAVIATVWRHIATFGRYIVGIFIGTAILKEDTGAAAMAYAFGKSIRSPIGTRLFGGYESYVHPKRWFESIAYEAVGSDPVLIRYKKSFALVSLFEIGTKNIGNVESTFNTVKIRYLRWIFDIEAFIIDSIDYYNSEKRQTTEKDNKTSKKINRFKIHKFSGGKGYNAEIEKRNDPVPTTRNTSGRAEELIMTGVYRLLKWSREDLQMKAEDGQSPFTGYPFPREIEIAIKELDLWLSHEKWFRSKSIPWRRGWLLYGPPGTGKSTLVRALGMSFDLPVYVFDLADMSNQQFTNFWEEMMTSTPCIALIEDIDNIFNGREYVGSGNQSNSHLTFDCLLNCISGVKQADGVFLVITTNHIENLDPAIGVPDQNGRSTRPGRIDKALCLGLMEEEQRLQLAKHILSDFPNLVEQTVKDGNGETAAQFQARCADIALRKFWTEGKTIVDDTLYKEVMHFKTKRKEQLNSLYPAMKPSNYDYESEL